MAEALNPSSIFQSSMLMPGTYKVTRNCSFKSKRLKRRSWRCSSLVWLATCDGIVVLPTTCLRCLRYLLLCTGASHIIKSSSGMDFISAEHLKQARGRTQMVFPAGLYSSNLIVRNNPVIFKSETTSTLTLRVYSVLGNDRAQPETPDENHSPCYLLPFPYLLSSLCLC